MVSSASGLEGGETSSSPAAPSAYDTKGPGNVLTDHPSAAPARAPEGGEAVRAWPPDHIYGQPDGAHEVRDSNTRNTGSVASAGTPTERVRPDNAALSQAQADAPSATSLPAAAATPEVGGPVDSSAAAATPARPRAPRKRSNPTDGTMARREGKMEGPVIFNLDADALTREEIVQAVRYCIAANEALKKGELSPTGRVKVTGKLKDDKEKAAAAERTRAARAGTPYGSDVAAHLPDTTWVGEPEPPDWDAHTNRVNSILGSQSGKYPEGYKPKRFSSKLEGGDRGN